MQDFQSPSLIHSTSARNVEITIVANIPASYVPVRHVHASEKHLSNVFANRRKAGGNLI